MKHPITGAIFDLDGTLLDSMYVWQTFGSDYLRSRSIEPKPEMDEIFKKLSLRQVAEYYKNEYPEITDPVEVLMSGVNKQVEKYYFDVVLKKPGVTERLEKFRRQGVKMCVATASDRYIVEAALKRNGLLEYFDGIYTCTEVGFGKDHPDVYIKALGFLGTRIETTYVFEDAPFAAETASKAGFHVVGIHDAFYESEQDVLKKCADVIIYDYSEMTDFFGF